MLDWARQYRDDADRMEREGCPPIISPLIWMAQIEDCRSQALKLEQEAELVLS
jgi:hypothetical protein